MATSSIKREVVITDTEQAEKFVEALEKSKAVSEIEHLIDKDKEKGEEK